MPKPISIVELLIESHEALLRKKGVALPRAREEAERAVRDLLGIVGGQKWHIPRKIRIEGLELRDAAIRDAWRRGVHRRDICRTFHISVSRFYQIINRDNRDEAAAPLANAG